MPGPVTDARAYELRERYHAAFGGAELPVPVEAIAEDLEGLRIEQGREDGLSGMLIPDRRLIWLNGDDVPERRRFTECSPFRSMRLGGGGSSSGTRCKASFRSTKKGSSS